MFRVLGLSLMLVIGCNSDKAHLEQHREICLTTCESNFSSASSEKKRLDNCKSTCEKAFQEMLNPTKKQEAKTRGKTSKS